MGTGMRLVTLLRVASLPVLAASVSPPCSHAQTVHSPIVYVNPAADDQDDMAIWVHPSDPSRSLIIGSDKSAGFVFLYDLDGSLVQSIPSPHPGNIDVRYHFRLGLDCVDLIAWNERAEEAIRVYRIDPLARTLSRIDDAILTHGGNYGFALQRMSDGKLFAYTGPKGEGPIRQYALTDRGGRVTGAPTGWQFSPASTIEGMVVDDETGYVYLGEEDVGIWRVNTGDDADIAKVTGIGDHGLTADVEGLAVYYLPDGKGYLMASSQGSDDYKIYERRPPHAFVGTFTIDGVRDADGIDVLNGSLNATFDAGIFLTHDGTGCSVSGCLIRAVRWQDIVSIVPGLRTDTAYWDSRRPACADGDDER